MNLTVYPPPATGILPTKAKEYIGVVSAGATAGTYYTVIDVSGAGIFNRLTANCRPDNTNYRIDLRFTIDGVTGDVLSGGANDLDIMKTRSFGPVDSTYSRGNSVDYLGPIYFKTSLKIEIKLSASSSYSINACVNYALV